MKSPEYVIRATSTQETLASILEQGFVAQSGKAMVSTDMVLAYEWALNPAHFVDSKDQKKTGSIVVMRVPSEVSVDNAIKTGIKVNHAEKVVSGYTGRHRYSRRQLALYNRSGQETEVRIPPCDVLLNIQPFDSLGVLLADVKASTKNFQKIACEDAAAKIAGTILEREDHFVAPGVNVHRVINSLMASTVETLIVNRIRSLSMDVKKVNGYTFQDLRQEQDRSNPVDKKELVYLLKMYQNQTLDSKFDLGRPELNRYVRFFIRQLAEESTLEHS